MPIRVWWLGGIVAVGLSAVPAWASAWAQPAMPVAVRSGEHPGFGRLVFDFGHRVACRPAREGEHVILRFDTDLAITPPTRVPRNVRAIEAGAHQADITVAEHASSRISWLGGRLVVDVFDPAGAPAKPPAVKPVAARRPTQMAPAQLAAAPSAPPPPAQPIAAPAPAAPPAPPAPPAPSMPQAEQPPLAESPPATPAAAPSLPSGPVALSAAKVTAPPQSGPALTIPLPASVGAAAFRRGDTAFVVFDEPRPIDLSGLQDDPVFGTAVVQLLPAATVLRFRLPQRQELALSQTPQGWAVGVVKAAAPTRPIGMQAADGEVSLPADATGDVVAIADPETGSSLLVVTQRVTGQAVPALRRTPEFDLLPTWQGVVVVPLADRLVLRTTNRGITLAAGPGGLATTPASAELQAQADAAGLTQHFDFRVQPPEVLLRRLRQQVAAASAAPPLGRGRLRQAAATTMIALGWGAEAEAMLRLAAADDPATASSPDALGLAAIAALLAARPSEADGIEDPRLSGSDDVTLWRAVRAAEITPGSAGAATGFAATEPLIDIYPPALRQRLLPLVFETMLEGGQRDVAARLLASRQDDPNLALARGMLREANGDTDGALAVFDALAAGKDQRLHAIAAVRAVEVRLWAGQIDAGQAADALDRLIYAWRGGKRELAVRERVAELRQRSGDWRAALGMLHETEAIFPDDRDAIRTRMKDCFAALLRDDALDRLTPLELVALVEENADLLPEGPAGEALEERLADRLLALDLPQRAASVLEKLMKAAPSPAGRAGFATRLAALRLRQNDPAGALAALAATSDPDLPPAIAESRALLAATARARMGDTAGAVAELTPVRTAASDAARAGILEQAKDWDGAERALADYVDKTVPETGALNEEEQRALVRYAAAAAQAGDEATLALLRTRYGARIPNGAFADMFHLLTAAPVQGVVDLPRAGRETVLAHDLPKTLDALRLPSATP
jgi:hypothetical protein